MGEKQKVLLCGDVEGRFKYLFNRVETINKKSGPFDFLLCVGNFFGANNIELEPYKNGMKTISIPTYILGPNRPEDAKHYGDTNGSEICRNLTHLGKRGLYTSSSGLKIAYLSGAIENGDDKDCGFDESDVIAIRNSCLKGQPSFRGVDVLMTSPWPRGIEVLDPNEPRHPYRGSDLVAWLAAQIKPRYHVCAMEGIHYERPPYRNQSQSENSIEIASRFIALAAVGNTEKRKWIYALNLTPVDRTRLSDLVQRTTDETGSPYPKTMLGSQPSCPNVEPKNVQFFYDMESKESKRGGRNSGDRRQNKKPKMEFDQAKCWFCLSSPEVSRHLVISVGTEVYLALARGGLVDEHFLILPVTHHQSLSILPEAVAGEMELYKKAITKYYASKDNVPVFYERNFKSSHCQLQAVPVHRNQATSLLEMFQEMAAANNFELEEIPRHSQLRQIASPGVIYFYVELPDGTMLYHRIKKEFPLQFGREVLASDRILDIPERADWRDCQLDIEQETELAKKIRNEFQPYDLDT